MKNKQKKKELSTEQLEIIDTKDFFDRTVPGVLRFYTDHYICGNFYKSCWAVTEYPPSTEETAILAHLADRNGVNLRINYFLYTSEMLTFNKLASYPLDIMSEIGYNIYDFGYQGGNLCTIYKLANILI